MQYISIYTYDIHIRKSNVSRKSKLSTCENHNMLQCVMYTNGKAGLNVSTVPMPICHTQ